MNQPMTSQPSAPAARSRSAWVKWVALGCGGVVLLVGAMVAAIAIPNLLSAREKARRYRTVQTLEALGEGLEAYRAAQGGYPPAASIDDLAAALAPYVVDPPRSDAWGNELRYACVAGAVTDRLASAGSDGEFEHPDLASYEAGSYPGGDLKRDLVYTSGGFLRYPGELD